MFHNLVVEIRFASSMLLTTWGSHTTSRTIEELKVTGIYIIMGEDHNTGAWSRCILQGRIHLHLQVYFPLKNKLDPCSGIEVMSHYQELWRFKWLLILKKCLKARCRVNVRTNWIQIKIRRKILSCLDPKTVNVALMGLELDPGPWSLSHEYSEILARPP